MISFDMLQGTKVCKITTDIIVGNTYNVVLLHGTLNTCCKFALFQCDVNNYL